MSDETIAVVSIVSLMIAVSLLAFVASFFADGDRARRNRLKRNRADLRGVRENARRS